MPWIWSARPRGPVSEHHTPIADEALPELRHFCPRLRRPERGRNAAGKSAQGGRKDGTWQPEENA